MNVVFDEEDIIRATKKSRSSYLSLSMNEPTHQTLRQSAGFGEAPARAATEIMDDLNVTNAWHNKDEE